MLRVTHETTYRPLQHLANPYQTNPTNTTPTPIPGGIIQMGARVYLPILGRFLQVDPVEGGTDNNYVYANDPVNEFDLDGRAIPFVVAGVLYVGGIAWSAYDFYKKPSWGNAGWLAASFVPGGSLIKASKSVKRVFTAITSIRTIGKAVSRYHHRVHRCITNLGRCAGSVYGKIQRRVNRFTHHQAYRRLNLQNQRRKQYTQRKGRYGQNYRYQTRRHYRR